jgi:hypothetical protein
LEAVGYHYPQKAVLHFIQTRNAGSTIDSLPYQMKYTDDYGNVHEHQVDCPDAVSIFYASSNVIDCNNQLRQDSLALEEKWVTQDYYFRLTMMLIGMSIVDTYLLAKYHDIVMGCNSLGLSAQQFAGALAFQLIGKVGELATKKKL